jgi:hypothetical protein
MQQHWKITVYSVAFVGLWALGSTISRHAYANPVAGALFGLTDAFITYDMTKDGMHALDYLNRSAGGPGLHMYQGERQRESRHESLSDACRLPVGYRTEQDENVYAPVPDYQGDIIWRAVRKTERKMYEEGWATVGRGQVPHLTMQRAEERIAIQVVIPDANGEITERDLLLLQQLYGSHCFQHVYGAVAN